MGTPVAAIGVELFIKLSGRAMLRAHGFSDYPMVVVTGSTNGRGINLQYTDEEIERTVDAAMPQIERVLSPHIAAQPVAV